MGLPQVNRLKHRQDFQLVYAKGSKYKSSHLVLRAWQNRGATNRPTSIGIVISQKVSKKAVIRNRIKRQIKAIIRPWLKELANNWQLVIIVLPEAIECNYQHFLRELKQLFQQVGLSNGN